MNNNNMNSLGESNDLNNNNMIALNNLNNLTNLTNMTNMTNMNNGSIVGLRERSAQINNSEFYDMSHPFSDGFLICTQLVKTGGADQGGLQVGDVFVSFGHFSQKNFHGLKSIAALVRRSAKLPISCVVWRKLETDSSTNGSDDKDTTKESGNSDENNKNNSNNNNKESSNNDANDNTKLDTKQNDTSDNTKNNNNVDTSKERIDDNGVKTVYQKLELKLTPLQSHDADGGGVLGSVINTWPLPEMKS